MSAPGEGGWLAALRARIGTQAAPPVIRVSFGQKELPVHGGPAHNQPMRLNMKFDPAGSLRNRDISPKRKVLLSPSVADAIVCDHSTLNMPSPGPWLHVLG